MSIPQHLKYTSHDEWIRVDGEFVVVGISDFAQEQLGELVHVELPEVGATVKQGGEICEVESVKAVAEIYAPIGGEVVEINEALEDAAEQINDAPYDTWFFKLRPPDPSQIDGLVDAAAYAAKLAD